jgi:superoxide dismutase, Cu-Zn family
MGTRLWTRTVAVLLAPALLAWATLATLPAVAAETGTVGASAELKNARGETVGSATLLPTSTGARIQVQVKGFTDAKAGERGIHIHAVGSCAAPDFTSAGGHFNPTAKKHGLNNPEGHHAGDLSNISFDAAGNANYEAVVQDIAFEQGAAGSIFDADGSAIVIHAGPDDLMTDPAGNSGSRIACGEFAAYVVPTGMPATGDGGIWTYTWLALLGSLAVVVAGLALLSTRARKAQG